MAKRRRVLMGVGALVFGSGAMSVNAALNPSVSPSSDMRVVVDGEQEDLDVLAGIIFRDGTSATDLLDPATLSTASGPNATVINDSTQNSLFTSDPVNNSPEGLDSADPDLLPQASVDPTDPSPGDNVPQPQNGELSFEVGLPLGEDGQIGQGDGSNAADNSSGPPRGMLQVRNNTGTSQDIQIEFDSFGNDVNNSNVQEGQVAEIFEFRNEVGDKISPNNSGGSIGSIPSSATVSSGNTHQIWLDFDTTGSLETTLTNAIEDDGDPFTANTDTIDLVDTIRVGQP